MANRAMKGTPGRCVHCLAHVAQITDDHLLPKSWYPDTTPANLEKWKIPACRPCNHEYGKLEAKLRPLFAACVDPHGEATSGIWQKVVDGFSPHKARSPIDALKRKLEHRRFMSRLRPVTAELAKHALPEIKNRPYGNMALQIPAADLHRFGAKLIRGTVYLADKRYLDDTDIGISLIAPDDEGDLQQLFELGQPFDRGLAIRIRRALDPNNGDMLFRFDIWDQFRIYGYAFHGRRPQALPELR